MVTCPECDGAIDIEEEDIDEGDVLSCDECGASVKVLGKNPLELESADDLDEEDEDEEEDEEDEEFEEAEEEKDEEAGDEWQ